MSLVIIADNEDGFIRQVSSVLREQPATEVVAVKTGEEALALARAEQPEAVVLGPSNETDAAFDAAARLTSMPESPAVVFVTHDLSTELMRRAMRLGVSDVLSAAEAPADIVASIEQARRAVRARHGSVEASAVPLAPARKAKIATVFGTKGGVGKSVLATNIAVALAEQQESVILVDLDLQSGDTAIMLQLVPERTIYDVTQVYDRLDADMLGAFLARHDCGVRALLAPVQPEQAEAVTGARLSHILDMLSGMADYIVIDTPAAINDVVLAALERSDEIYAVATMDVPSLKSIRVSLQKLAQLGIGADKVGLILNRADSKVGLTAADVQDVTECPIVARIPSDRLVPRSVNKGVPVVRDAPRTLVSRSIVELSRRVADRGEVSSDVA